MCKSLNGKGLRKNFICLLGEYTMTNTNISNILDHFIGLDQFLNSNFVKQPFPPYNIVRKGDNYNIEVAVAGYTANDLAVTYLDGKLHVEGNTLLESPGVSVNNTEPEVAEYIYKGIAKRKFKLTFPLSPQIIVDGTKLENGLLCISMHREIPPSQLPKKIPIL